MMPLITRWTLPVSFSSTRKSLLPMNAIIVGCDKPLTTVLTERLESSIDGPVSEAETTAVFVNCPVDWGTTTMLTIDCAPFDIEPRLQVMVAEPVHEPCVGVAETKLTPPDSVSVITTFVAGDGPALVTVRR